MRKRTLELLIKQEGLDTFGRFQRLHTVYSRQSDTGETFADLVRSDWLDSERMELLLKEEHGNSEQLSYQRPLADKIGYLRKIKIEKGTDPTNIDIGILDMY